MLKLNCARRKSCQNAFGQGFDSPRLHHEKRQVSTETCRFSMISVPSGTGDICLRHMKERILYHACVASISCGASRISYRVSDISFMQEFVFIRKTAENIFFVVHRQKKALASASVFLMHIFDFDCRGEHCSSAEKRSFLDFPMGYRRTFALRRRIFLGKIRGRPMVAPTNEMMVTGKHLLRQVLFYFRGCPWEKNTCSSVKTVL